MDPGASGTPPQIEKVHPEPDVRNSTNVLDDTEIDHLHTTIENQSEKLWQRTTFFITLSLGGAVYCISTTIDIWALVCTSIIAWLLFTIALIQHRRQDKALNLMRGILRNAKPKHWYNNFKSNWDEEKNKAKWYEWPSYNIMTTYLILWFILTALLVAYCILHSWK